MLAPKCYCMDFFPAALQFVTPLGAHLLYRTYQLSPCIFSAITFEHHLCFLTSQWQAIFITVAHVFKTGLSCKWYWCLTVPPPYFFLPILGRCCSRKIQKKFWGEYHELWLTKLQKLKGSTSHVPILTDSVARVIPVMSSTFQPSL